MENRTSTFKKQNIKGFKKYSLASCWSDDIKTAFYKFFWMESI